MYNLSNSQTFSQAAFFQHDSKESFEKQLKKSSLSFDYGQVSLADFSKRYSTYELSSRKIQAIPKMLIAGLIKTTYHLATIILFSYGYCEHKIKVYNLLRDFEEAFGHLITLFNDRIGSYLVQRSLFHKECYNFYNSSKLDPQNLDNPKYLCEQRLDSYFENGQLISTPPLSVARLISMLDLLEMSPEKRKKMIELFNLKNKFDQLGGEFYLSKCDKSFLDEVSLEDFILDTNKFNYALIKDQTLKNRPIMQLREIDLSTGIFIKKRFKKLVEKRNLDESNLDIERLTFSQFYQLSGKKLNEILDRRPTEAYRYNIPTEAYYILNDEQLNTLDFSKMPIYKLSKLCPFLKSEREFAIFGKIPAKKLQPILSKLTEDELPFISDVQLKELDFSDLSEFQLRKLFPNDHEVKKRFGLLSNQQAQVIRSKLGNYVDKYLV